MLNTFAVTANCTWLDQDLSYLLITMIRRKNPPVHRVHQALTSPLVHLMTAVQVHQIVRVRHHLQQLLLLQVPSPAVVLPRHQIQPRRLPPATMGITATHDAHQQLLN